MITSQYSLSSTIFFHLGPCHCHRLPATALPHKLLYTSWYHCSSSHNYCYGNVKPHGTYLPSRNSQDPELSSTVLLTLPPKSFLSQRLYCPYLVTEHQKEGGNRLQIYICNFSFSSSVTQQTRIYTYQHVHTHP